MFQVLLGLGFVLFAICLSAFAYDYQRSRQTITAIVFGSAALWVYTAGFLYLIHEL